MVKAYRDRRSVAVPRQEPDPAWRAGGRLVCSDQRLSGLLLSFIEDVVSRLLHRAAKALYLEALKCLNDMAQAEKTSRPKIEYVIFDMDGTSLFTPPSRDRADPDCMRTQACSSTLSGCTPM